MTQAITPHGVAIEYETYGSPADPALLVVMGFGSQRISWPPELCRLLVDSGLYVIPYDNRDCGLSQKFDGVDANLGAVREALAAGDLAAARAAAPYTLSEMALDGIGLLDALGIEKAHIVGSSMGGMIVQTMAIEHPTRVLSMTSIMSTTGEAGYGQSAPEALQALLTPAPADRAGYIEASLSALIWASRRYADPDYIKDLAARSFDRSYYPAGSARQFAAIQASGSRAEKLRALSVPSLVIHGLDDTLITPSGGERTAELIPNARLMMVDDMGHDRPRPLWPELVKAITEHTASAS